MTRKNKKPIVSQFSSSLSRPAESCGGHVVVKCHQLIYRKPNLEPPEAVKLDGPMFWVGKLATGEKGPTVRFLACPRLTIGDHLHKPMPTKHGRRGFP